MQIGMEISGIGGIFVRIRLGIGDIGLESGSILYTVDRIEFNSAPAFFGRKRRCEVPKMGKNA